MCSYCCFLMNSKKVTFTCILSYEGFNILTVYDCNKGKPSIIALQS